MHDIIASLLKLFAFFRLFFAMLLCQLNVIFVENGFVLSHSCARLFQMTFFTFVAVSEFIFCDDSIFGIFSSLFFGIGLLSFWSFLFRPFPSFRLTLVGRRVRVGSTSVFNYSNQ